LRKKTHQRWKEEDLAAGDNDVFTSIDNGDSAIRVHNGQISRIEAS
jgi:hypothetical protein